MLDFLKKVTAGQTTPSNIPQKYLADMADQIEKTSHIDSYLYEKYNVKRGLRNANGTGVVVGITNIGEVVGYKIDENKNKLPCDGELYYRGYEIKDLVSHYIEEDRFGFEEVIFLLLFGDLPSKKEFAAFTKYINDKRELPANFARDMILTSPSQSIMNKLARSVLALYCYDEDPDNTSIANVLRQEIDLIGYFPALLAYAYQAKRSHFDNRTLHLRKPSPELSTAENILRMIRSDGKYTDLEAKCLDISLILHAEHGGGNNSAFATHLISSSGTDTYAAISASIGSLKGPKHGGANIMVIDMINDLKATVGDINDYNKVDNYLKDVLMKKANDKTGLIYGMGHAIYTLSDPRTTMLKGMAKQLAEQSGRIDEFNLCQHIEDTAASLYEEVHGVKKIMCANIDLYSGLVYSILNIPHDLATPLFALARLAGWSAHRIEELTSGGKLIRPAYIGISDKKTYTPLNKRKPLSSRK
ncbi:MAG: citrate synthase [Eubacteriales bacterium]|nr:citrate synthase [Eubacteriales bacterium]MDY3333180.1 citrate synthase [Gallibacter sp.]